MSDDCKYCNGDTAVASKNKHIRFEIVGNHLMISDMNFVVLDKEIKYCPFCGTKLDNLILGIEEGEI